MQPTCKIVKTADGGSQLSGRRVFTDPCQYALVEADGTVLVTIASRNGTWRVCHFSDGRSSMWRRFADAKAHALELHRRFLAGEPLNPL